MQSSTTPLSFEAPAKKNPANIRMHLIFPETRVSFLLLIVWVCLHLHLCSGLQKTHLFCTRVCFGRSKSSKVDDFGTNRKRLCDFLLVRHYDCGLSCTVSEIRRLIGLVKNCLFFIPLSHLAPPLPMFPLEFRAEVNHQETRVKTA